MTYRSPGRRRTAVVLLLVAVGAAASIGTALAFEHARRQDPRDGAPVRFAPQRRAVPSFAGDPAAGVAALARAFSHVRRAVVVPAPAADGPGVELQLEVLTNDFAPPSIARAQWESNILAGAVAARYRSSGLPQLVAVGPVLVDPSGAKRTIGGGIGNVAPDQGFLPVSAADVRHVADRARKAGLTVVDAQRVHLIDDGMTFVLTSEDPARDVAALRSAGGVLPALLGTSPANFEGVYVEIRDPTGRAAYIEATAPRDGASTTWARPDLGVRVGHGFPGAE